MTHSSLLIATLAFSLALFCFSSASAQSVDRTQIEKEIHSLYDQIKEKEKLYLAPSREDQETYAKFLEQPDAGLIRLLPREKYDGKLSIRGGGAYYSFARLTHEYGYGSDIALEQGKLKVGFAGMDFGYLIPLSDIDLDKATLEHPAVKALAEYQPPPTEDEVRAEWRQSSNGHKLGEFLGMHSVPAKESTTYVLRSLNYDQWDILVVFRVVRQDADGSLILLWKLLKTFPKPTAIRSERD